jgi:hypothetical protein
MEQIFNQLPEQASNLRELIAQNAPQIERAVGEFRENMR